MKEARQNVTLCLIPVIQNFQNRQIQSERKCSSAGSGGREMRSYCLQIWNFFWGNDQNFLKLVSAYVSQPCEYAKRPELYILKSEFYDM